MKNKFNSNKELETAIGHTKLLKQHVMGERELSTTHIAVCQHSIQALSKKSFYFFAKYVLEFDLLTIETHKKWADNLQNKLGIKSKIMRLKPRATFKSSLYGVCFILWLWSCISAELRLFYTSSNALLLEEISDKINQYLLPGDSSIFQMAFEIRRDNEGKDSPKNTGDVFNIIGRSGKGFSLILRTSGGSTVGIHPNMILVDDPMDINDRESATIRAKKERWFDSLTPLIVPFYYEGIDIATLLFIATRWHQNDLVSHIQRIDSKLSEKEKWDIEIESIYDENKKSNYPEFITDEKIAHIKATISEVFFACQYENNPISEGLRVFDVNKLHFIRKGQISYTSGQLACFFDPSLGKSSSDWPAVIWTHFENNKLTIIDAFDSNKIELASLIPLIANKNKLMGVSYILFEDNGVSLIETSIRESHKRINHHIFIESKRAYGNKDERIISIQPDLYSGFVQFFDDWEEEHAEMREQLLFFAPGGQGHQYDDFPDVIEMAVSHYKSDCFEFVRYEGLG